MKNRKNSQLGFVSFKTAVILAIIFSLGYSGVKIGQFYFCYYDSNSFTEILLRESHRAKNDVLKDKIFKKAKNLGIWIKPEEIKVSRTKDFVDVELSYQEVFYISIFGHDIDIKYFDFEIRRRQKLVL